VSDGRRLPKRTNTNLSWPHERFFSSLVFATVALSQRSISLAVGMWEVVESGDTVCSVALFVVCVIVLLGSSAPPHA